MEQHPHPVFPPSSSLSSCSSSSLPPRFSLKPIYGPHLKTPQSRPPSPPSRARNMQDGKRSATKCFLFCPRRHDGARISLSRLGPMWTWPRPRRVGLQCHSTGLLQLFLSNLLLVQTRISRHRNLQGDIEMLASCSSRPCPAVAINIFATLLSDRPGYTPRQAGPRRAYKKSPPTKKEGSRRCSLCLSARTKTRMASHHRATATSSWATTSSPSPPPPSARFGQPPTAKETLVAYIGQSANRQTLDLSNGGN